MGPEQDVPLHLISHTPLANTAPPPLNTLAVPFCRLLKSTLTWVVAGSRHLDIVEGDRERSQREHAGYLRDLSTPAWGAGSVSVICRPPHIVFMEPLTTISHFCLEGERKKKTFLGCRVALSASECECVCVCGGVKGEN